jgi:hypothetical protein
MGPHSIASTRLGLAVLVAVLGWQINGASSRPIGSTEAYCYDRFVRPTTRQVLAQELANRDVLYTLIEKRSIGLFHVSPFTVRLPSLLSGLLFLWSAWRLGRLPALVLAGLFALVWGGFAVADGRGAAIALDLVAIHVAIRYFTSPHGDAPYNLNLCGACLGLSVVARQDFMLPSATIALVILGILLVKSDWRLWTDRVFIPALVVTLVFLVLPLSHAHAAAPFTPDLTVKEAAELQLALDALQTGIGSARVAIGASPTVEPVVNFYRAQHRATTWGRAETNLTSRSFDYYVLATGDAEVVQQRHLVVLYRNLNYVVARRASASM